MGTRFALTGAGVREDDTGTVEERRLLAVTTFQGSAKKLSGDYRRMTVTVPKPVVVNASDASAEAPVSASSATCGRHDTTPAIFAVQVFRKEIGDLSVGQRNASNPSPWRFFSRPTYRQRMEDPALKESRQFV